VTRNLPLAAGATLVSMLAAGCRSEVPGFDTPASALHDPVDDVYLVSNVRGAPLAKDGNGYIARVAPDGSMRRHWIEGGRNGVTLHAPKGLALHGDTLWVADIDVVRRFDRHSGAYRGEVAVPGASCLEDVAAGPDGAIYVTDSGLDANRSPTGTDAIWRLGAAGEATPLVRSPELGQPGGLVAHKGGLYVVSWRDGAFCQIGYDGVRIDLGKAPTAGLVGLARVESTEAGQAPGWYCTSWIGKCVYRFDVTGGVGRLPAEFEQPADCGFDEKRRRLLVPLSGVDRLELLPL
jgi:sugar lactone lactonase YvrE